MKVIDRQGTGEEPFPTDCYFACVDLRTDFVRIDAKELAADGYAQADEGMVLSGDSGSLTLAAPVPKGKYVVAFRLLDHPYGQGAAEVVVDGRTAVVMSIYGLACSIEGGPCLENIGYRPTDARGLALNVILHAAAGK